MQARHFPFHYLMAPLNISLLPIAILLTLTQGETRKEGLL